MRTRHGDVALAPTTAILTQNQRELPMDEDTILLLLECFEGLTCLIEQAELLQCVFGTSQPAALASSSEHAESATFS